MRAREFITEPKTRRPEISLRHVHYLKQERNRVAASHARRLPIIRIMYTNTGKEHERIELEKARLELEQQKADLAAAKSDVQAETFKAISGKAKAGSKVNQPSRSKIASMAKTEMRRRKK